MVDRKVTGPITIERQWFIDSRQGNIKDDYYFEKKLGSGGYGAVYLAKHKKTGKGRERSVTQYLFSVIAYQSVSLKRNYLLGAIWKRDRKLTAGFGWILPIWISLTNLCFYRCESGSKGYVERKNIRLRVI